MGLPNEITSKHKEIWLFGILSGYISGARWRYQTNRKLMLGRIVPLGGEELLEDVFTFNLIEKFMHRSYF